MNASETSFRLRLNQGDASEARVYYLPHLVARSLGFFAAAGLDVAFVTSETGGATIRGGQIPMLMSGHADLAVGGPMVTMRMAAEGSGRLVTVCAAVAASPWYLVGASRAGAFDWTQLKGRQVVDLGNIGTASMSFDWLLARHGLAGQVEVRAGSGDLQADLETIRRDAGLFGFHSLHHLAPMLQAEGLQLLVDFASAMGPVPWSSYIARPELLDRQRAAFDAFVHAIGQALHWIASAPTDAIVDLAQPYFADFPRPALMLAIDRFRASGVWPRDVVVPREAYGRFHDMLLDRQWLPCPVPYEDQVDAGVVSRASGEQKS